MLRSVDTRLAGMCMFYGQDGGILGTVDAIHTRSEDGSVCYAGSLGVGVSFELEANMLGSSEKAGVGGEESVLFKLELPHIPPSVHALVFTLQAMEGQVCWDSEWSACR